eukprot:295936-Pelagomonas_calceolata.AAC.1
MFLGACSARAMAAELAAVCAAPGTEQGCIQCRVMRCVSCLPALMSLSSTLYFPCSPERANACAHTHLLLMGCHTIIWLARTAGAWALGTARTAGFKEACTLVEVRLATGATEADFAMREAIVSDWGGPVRCWRIKQADLVGAMTTASPIKSLGLAASCK